MNERTKNILYLLAILSIGIYCFGAIISYPPAVFGGGLFFAGLFTIIAIKGK